MGEKLPSTNVRYFKKNTKKHKTGLRTDHEWVTNGSWVGYKINETRKMAHLSLQGHNSKGSVINGANKKLCQACGIGFWWHIPKLWYWGICAIISMVCANTTVMTQEFRLLCIVVATVRCAVKSSVYYGGIWKARENARFTFFPQTTGMEVVHAPKELL